MNGDESETILGTVKTNLGSENHLAYDEFKLIWVSVTFENVDYSNITEKSWSLELFQELNTNFKSIFKMNCLAEFTISSWNGTLLYNKRIVQITESAFSPQLIPLVTFESKLSTTSNVIAKQNTIVINIATKKILHFINTKMGIQTLLPFSIYGESCFLFQAFLNKKKLPLDKPIQVDIEITNLIDKQPFYKQSMKYLNLESLFFGGQSILFSSSQGSLDNIQPLLVNYSIQSNTWYEIIKENIKLVYGYLVIYLPIKLQLNLNYKFTFVSDNKNILAQLEMSI